MDDRQGDGQVLIGKEAFFVREPQVIEDPAGGLGLIETIVERAPKSQSHIRMRLQECDEAGWRLAVGDVPRFDAIEMASEDRGPQG